MIPLFVHLPLVAIAGLATGALLGLIKNWKKATGKDGVLSNLVKGVSGAGLTNAQIEQNDWNAEEAQKQRDWTENMDATKYQRQTQDMRAAGLNPAMMYGGSQSASSLSGDAASGSSVGNPSPGVFNSILDVIFAKQRMENLRIEGEKMRNEGKAALISAYAARENAGTNARNAGTAEWNARIAEARKDIERDLANSNIDLNAASIDKMAEDAAYVRELRSYVSKNYEVAMKNADSSAKQAIAAMRQADAAIQNAATHSYIADYQTDLYYSESLLNSIVKGEHEEVYKKLPQKLQLEIDNMRKEGVVLDERGRLIHRQGNLASAQLVKTYVTTATDVAKTVASFIPGASSSPNYTNVYGDSADVAAGIIGGY